MHYRVHRKQRLLAVAVRWRPGGGGGDRLLRPWYTSVSYRRDYCKLTSLGRYEDFFSVIDNIFALIPCLIPNSVVIDSDINRIIRKSNRFIQLRYRF